MKTSNDLSIEEQNKAVLRRWYDEMYANQRWELMQELAGPLYIRHEPTGTFTVTVEEHAQRMEKAISRFENMGEFSYDLFAEGDKVCVLGRFKREGKEGAPETKSSNFIQIFRLKDGKLVETWYTGMARDVEW